MYIRCSASRTVSLFLTGASVRFSDGSQFIITRFSTDDANVSMWTIYLHSYTNNLCHDHLALLSSGQSTRTHA